MENIRIKAAPQALLAGAGSVQKTASDIRNHFSEIEAAVNRSAGYWQGDAAEAHRASYQDMKGTAEEIFARILEHASDLQKMAQTYIGAEQATREMSEDLPSDVIL